jgi:hypothetical protein
MHALAGDGTEENLLRTIEYWHRRESTGILAFNLGQQFLDIIEIAALPEAHFMRFRFVATLLRWLFHLVQASTKSFVDNRLKWCAQFGRNGPCPVHHIIIY